MEEAKRELTPVKYGPDGIKYRKFLHFNKKNLVRLHWHDRVELIALRKGRVRVGFGSRMQTMDEGQIYIVPPRVPHQMQTDSREVQYDVIMFELESFLIDTPFGRKMLLSMLRGEAEFRMVSGSEELLDCFDELVRCVETESLESAALVFRLLYLLFENELLSFSGKRNENPSVNKAIDYMKEAYCEKISIEELSKSLGYSNAHFCRLFKEKIGLTPLHYLKILRLEEASRLLTLGHCHSISEVSEKCGFSDANYFARCFRLHFGLSPSAYQKSSL